MCTKNLKKSSITNISITNKDGGVDLWEVENYYTGNITWIKQDQRRTQEGKKCEMCENCE